MGYLPPPAPRLSSAVPLPAELFPCDHCGREDRDDGQYTCRGCGAPVDRKPQGFLLAYETVDFNPLLIEPCGRTWQ